MATMTLTGAQVAVRSGLLSAMSPAAAMRMSVAVARTGFGLPALAAVSAARWPDQVALVDDYGQLTYRELTDRVDLLAGALEHTHDARGGRIALMCRNHRGFVEGLLAAARVGADVLLLNTDFPGPQLAQVLSGRTFDVVVADEEFSEELREAGFHGSMVIADGSGPDSTSELIRLGNRPTKADRVGAITLLTSGTTGTPKGAPRVPSPLAVAGVSISVLSILKPRTNEVMLISPPLFHGFGMAQLALGLTLGSTIVLHRRFDAGRVLADLDTYSVTHLAVVPVMLQRLLAARAEASAPGPRTLRSVLTGAAPLSPTLANEFMDVFGDLLFNGYGSSEVGVATIAAPADLRDAPGTVGRPVLGTAVQVLDEAGRPVPTGQTGGIYIASRMVFDGYTGGDDKPRVGKAVSTGDRGFVDAEGRLTIVGREDDMILSGGENVYPQEIEDVLAGHPDVADVTVIGVDDPEFGQRLKAFAVLHPGRHTSADELTAHVRMRVARYKVPREIVLLDDLPRNPTGKVLKRALPQ